MRELSVFLFLILLFILIKPSFSKTRNQADKHSSGRESYKARFGRHMRGRPQ